MTGTTAHTNLDDVKQFAVLHAICPVSLVELRTRPNEVCALLFNGHRVETALYHLGSIISKNVLNINRSPVTHLPVDGFKLMPKPHLWDFVDFLDWDEDGFIRVSELSIALAAILPLNEERLERLIYERFLTSNQEQDQLLSLNDVFHFHYPTFVERFFEILASAPSVPMRDIWRFSNEEEILAWFDYWDHANVGQLALDNFRYMIAKTLYSALGDDECADMRENVVNLFFSEGRFGFL